MILLEDGILKLNKNDCKEIAANVYPSFIKAFKEYIEKTFDLQEVKSLLVHKKISKYDYLFIMLESEILNVMEKNKSKEAFELFRNAPLRLIELKEINNDNEYD